MEQYSIDSLREHAIARDALKEKEIYAERLKVAGEFAKKANDLEVAKSTSSPADAMKIDQQLTAISSEAMNNGIRLNRIRKSGNSVAKSIDGMFTGMPTSIAYGNFPRGSYEPLLPQELSETVRYIGPTVENFKLYSRLPKVNYYRPGNPTLEVARQRDPGMVGNSFMGEGSFSVTAKSQYEKIKETVAFLGQTRITTFQSAMFDNIGGDLMARTKQDAVISLIGDVSSSLFDADADIDNFEFNGIWKQHWKWGKRWNDTTSAWTVHDYQNDSEIVIDLKGVKLNNEVVNRAMQNLAYNFGTIGKKVMFMSPKALKEFSDSYRTNFIPANTPNINAGTSLNQYISNFGTVDFEYDITLGNQNDRPIAFATNPSTPVGMVAANQVSVLGTANGTYCNSKFDGTYAGKRFAYAFAPVFSVTQNINGTSTGGKTFLDDPKVIQVSSPAYPAAVDVTNGTWGLVKIVIPSVTQLTTAFGTAWQSIKSFNVYRADLGTAAPVAGEILKYTKIGRVKVDAAPSEFVDRNYRRANTEDAILYIESSDVIHIGELNEGLIMYDIPTSLALGAQNVATFLWGMTPLLPKPRHIIRFTNIGSETPTTVPFP